MLPWKCCLLQRPSELFLTSKYDLVCPLFAETRFFRQTHHFQSEKKLPLHCSLFSTLGHEGFFLMSLTQPFKFLAGNKHPPARDIFALPEGVLAPIS